MGSGDSAIYPGGAPDTGEQTNEPRQRVNQTITRCDIHHNTLGYSGTMGNGTRVVGNHFYDNGTGITTDSFYAGGHPGYPQDSARFEKNQIYSNNFNTFLPGSDVDPRVPVPVGVGILIAGGNNNNISGNRIYDNWRRGTMLIEVPDSFSKETSTTVKSTSHRNRFHNNVMGIAPDGTKMPNGVDFWWDEPPYQKDNCWYDNGEVTTDPPGPLMPSTAATRAPASPIPARSPPRSDRAPPRSKGTPTTPRPAPGSRRPTSPRRTGTAAGRSASRRRRPERRS